MADLRPCIVPSSRVWDRSYGRSVCTCPVFPPLFNGGLYLAPLGFVYRAMDRYEEAIATFKTLLTRNPDFVPAYAQLAICYLLQWGSQRSQDPQTLEQALTISQKAIALNDFAPWSHATLGYVYAYQKQYEQAMAEIERAIALEPNFAWGYAVLADMLSFVGRPEEAIGLVEK